MPPREIDLSKFIAEIPAKPLPKPRTPAPVERPRAKAEIIEAPASMHPPSFALDTMLDDPRERMFVQYYIESGGNGAQSALASGYGSNVRVAAVRASHLLRRDNIKKAMARYQAELAVRYDFGPARILREFAKIAAADVELKGNDKVKALQELAKFSRMYPGDRLEVSGSIDHAHRIDIESLDSDNREQLRSALTALKAKQIEAKVEEE